MKKNIAVILASGTGSRFGSNLPKQFIKVAGKTIFEHSVDIFQKHTKIDEIAIVVKTEFENKVEKMVISNQWTKVKKILIGGKERSDSTLSALSAYSEDDINLIIHDSVRPLLSPVIVDRVIESLDVYSAVDVAINAADTIIKIKPEINEIVDIPTRSFLRRGQTPQAFDIKVLREAYKIAMNDKDFVVTDDCGVVKKYYPQIPIKVVAGEESNVKLTHPEDLYLIEKLFQLKSFTLDGEYNPAELNNKVLVIFGGSSGIGKDMANIAREQGAKVYVFSRSFNNVNISNFDDVKNSLKSVYEKENKIDYVVNTAAILRKEPLNHMDNDSIRCMIETNYIGMINVAKVSYDYLKKSKGQLLFFTSSSYTRGRAFYSIYSSSKAAAVNFTQALSEEWGIDGIKVNCINPERTNTPMRKSNFGIEDESTLLKSINVAKASLQALLSDFTGQIIDIKL